MAALASHAHAYTAESIKRVVELGVRTIEHGNLVDDEAAASMVTHGAYAVPTLVTYDATSRVGRELGITAETLAKNESVRKGRLRSLEILKRHGVKTGLGTDLLGEMHKYQSDELSIRDVLGPFEVICQATAVGAEIVGLGGELGVIAPNALADLLVVNGDPLMDIRALSGQGEHVGAIMKAGRWVHPLNGGR